MNLKEIMEANMPAIDTVVIKQIGDGLFDILHAPVTAHFTPHVLANLVGPIQPVQVTIIGRNGKVTYQLTDFDEGSFVAKRVGSTGSVPE